LKRIKLFMLLALAAAMLTGCGSNAATSPSPSPMATAMQSTAQPSAAPDAESGATPWVKDGKATPENAIETAEDAARQSKAMEDALEQMAEVNGADAVAIGQTALVGLEWAASYRGGMDAQMKKKALTQVQTVNKSISAVCVTDDQTLAQKIGSLKDELDGASDLSEIKARFEELAQEITDKK